MLQWRRTARGHERVQPGLIIQAASEGGWQGQVRRFYDLRERYSAAGPCSGSKAPICQNPIHAQGNGEIM